MIVDKFKYKSGSFYRRKLGKFAFTYRAANLKSISHPIIPPLTPLPQ
jgi:hypothetical protein